MHRQRLPANQRRILCSSGLGSFSSSNPAGGGNDPWQIGDVAAAASQFYAIPNTNTTQFAWINDDACD